MQAYRVLASMLIVAGGLDKLPLHKLSLHKLSLHKLPLLKLSFHKLSLHAGAWVAGPRLGRFRDGKPRHIPGHNAVFYVTGVLLLW